MGKAFNLAVIRETAREQALLEQNTTPLTAPYWEYSVSGYSDWLLSPEAGAPCR